MNKKEYEEKLECLITQAEIFNKQIEELKNIKIEDDGVWEPKYGEDYWYIDSFGNVYKDKWINFGDEFRYSVGNVFKTKEEAKFEVERRKVLAELKCFSCKFRNGDANHYITFYDNLKLDYTCDHYQNRQGTLYFESREKLEEAVESVGEDRIRKYLFGIEY